MKNDSIIFDLDGTLWDATPTTSESWNNGLRSMGVQIELTADDIKRVTGAPQAQCIQKLLPELYETNSQLVKILSSYEQKGIQERGGRIYEGVIEGIENLAGRYPLFIVSNCDGWYLDLFLQLSGLKSYFQDFDCFGSSRVKKSVMILNLQEKHGLKTPVYIGDTSTDEKAADEAGVDFIHAQYGFGHPEKKALSFSSFRELVAYFDA